MVTPMDEIDVVELRVRLVAPHEQDVVLRMQPNPPGGSGNTRVLVFELGPETTVNYQPAFHPPNSLIDVRSKIFLHS